MLFIHTHKQTYYYLFIYLFIKKKKIKQVVLGFNDLLCARRGVTRVSSN